VRPLPVVLVPLLLAVGCIGGSSTGRHATLRIAFGPDDGSPGLVIYHLSCGPDRGTVADPAAACVALAHHPRLTSPPRNTGSCGGTIGAWSVTIAGTYRGDPVRVRYGTCDGQVYQWMHIASYTPCPGNFTDFTCARGPYAFGRAHLRDLYVRVPNLVGMTVTQATAILRRHGVRVTVVACAKHHSHLVAAQAPDPGTSAKVYQVVRLTPNRGCGFC
jgi:PASTA domain